MEQYAKVRLGSNESNNKEQIGRKRNDTTQNQPKMSLSDYTFLIVKIKYFCYSFVIVVDVYEDQVLSSPDS